MAPEITPDEGWKLPLSVVGPIDVGRLLREVEILDNFLLQATIREPGTSVKLPKTSRLMDEFVQLNKLNVLQPADRNKLKVYLAQLKDHAPVLHMSFSADPSPLFMQRLITWLRTEISATILVRIGLQPTIGAGCVVRTPNRYIDLSLRERFRQNKHTLVKKLSEIQIALDETVADVAAVEAPPVVPSAAPPVAGVAA